jgi:predicted ester cyclase
VAVGTPLREELIKRACEALNRHDLKRFSEVFDDSVITIDPARGNPVGRSQAATEVVLLLEAFPDLHVDLEEVIESGDRTVSLMTVSGTNTGAWRGHAPTGRLARLRMCRVGEWVDSRVVTTGSYWDEMSLLSQLGLEATL